MKRLCLLLNFCLLITIARCRLEEFFEEYNNGNYQNKTVYIPPSITEFMRSNVTDIIPGTKWCGPGNIASDYEDLGYEEATDRCCREHDHCPDTIAPFQNKYGLSNNSSFTRLNCKCDEKFYACLKSVEKDLADRIGIIYFDVTGSKCFKHEFPQKECDKYCTTYLGKKCVSYVLYRERSPRYQWFDLPPYDEC